MADDDPIDATRFRTMLPKPKVDTVEQIDGARFRNLTGQQPQQEQSEQPDTDKILSRVEAMLAPPERRFDVLDPDDLREGEVRRSSVEEVRAEILRYEDADGFDTRLDDVVRRFRDRYYLPIIVEAGRSDGFDRPERPAANFYIFDAPISRMATASYGPTLEERTLDDFLFDCIRQAEKDADFRVQFSSDFSEVSGPRFEVGIRLFLPSVESSLMQRLLQAEVEGKAKLRKYGVDETRAREAAQAEREALEAAQAAQAERVASEALQERRAIRRREAAFVAERTGAAKQYAAKLQRDLRDVFAVAYAERDAERKRRTWMVGSCAVQVGRNEEGGYYYFVRCNCDDCRWTSGAVYFARTPEENTPELAKSYGCGLATEHSLYHRTIRQREDDESNFMLGNDQ